MNSALPSIVAAFIFGALMVGAILYFYFRGQLLRERMQNESALREKDMLIATNRDHSEQSIRQQKEILEQRVKDHIASEQKMKEHFTLLAQEVLTKNLDAQIKALKTENAHDLDKKKLEFNQSFDEIKNTLKATGDKIQLFEKERTDQYAKIEKQIHDIAQQEQKLIFETERLKSALTTSQSVRGRWGELVLRNILEQSDLVNGIDFEEQALSAGIDGAILRPDFVIKLPQSGQHLVIDSKASIFESYLEAENTPTEEVRQALHQDFSNRLRDRVRELASKEYQNHVSKSLPYVILFVPSESAIRAAFDIDPNLFQFAMEKKVFISSPATILPLIMLIARAWKEHRLSEKAFELSKVVDEIGKRLDLFVKRLGGVQRGLDQANKAWNEAIDKSWNGNQSVQKSIEKARELGGGIPEVAELLPLDSATRQISQQSDPQIPQQISLE